MKKQTPKFKSKKMGFTLIEMLLSVAMIALISGIGIPIYQSFQNNNSLDIAVETMSNISKRASLLARASLYDSTWGIKVMNGSLVIFKGSSYINRDITYDEIYSISDSMIIAGQDEYVFNKFSGLPVSGGTISFTSINNETKNITINAKGTILY